MGDHASPIVEQVEVTIPQPDFAHRLMEIEAEEQSRLRDVVGSEYPAHKVIGRGAGNHVAQHCQSVGVL